MYDIGIIGAGTAGLTAAIYGLRAGKKVIVFEENVYGGQIINSPTVENYPAIKNISGFDYAMNLYNQAKDLGVEIVYNSVLKILDGNVKIIVADNKDYEVRSIILATGVKRRPLDIDNEERLVGKGISYCATCDGFFYKDKIVAVVGGGNTALEDAIFLSNYCKEVYIIHRRDEFRGESNLVNILKSKENIKLIYNSIVIKINGNDKLDSIDIKNNVNYQDINLKIDGLFIMIGQIPKNDNFKDLVQLDNDGYIVASEDCKTNIKGIYVAGDCRTKKVRQLVTAASDGAIAAISAVEYINNLNE